MSNDAAGDDSPNPDGHSRFSLLEPPDWRRYTRYHFLLAKYLFFAGVAFILWWCLDLIGDVLFPVFISLLIAYVLDPTIDWFEERGINRTVGILIVIFSGLLLGVLFVIFLYPTIVDQVRTVIDRVPKLVELVQTRTIPWIERTFEYEVPATVSAGIEKYGQSLGNYLPTLANRVGTWAQSIVSGTGAIVIGLLNTIMIPIFSFYFLRDFDRIRLKLAEFIPEHRRDVVLTRLREMDDVVGEWVRGQIQVATILGILYAIGLSIAFSMAGIDIQSGIAIGLLAGALNFIPYFGVVVGIILATLMVIINWSGFGPLLAVGIVFVAVQTLEGYIITPKIVGEKVGLSPVTVIIVLLIGGELYGLFGILLAIPLFGALKVLFPDIVRYYRQTPFFTGRGLVPSSSGEGGPPDGQQVDASPSDPEGKDGVVESGITEEAAGEPESEEQPREDVPDDGDDQTEQSASERSDDDSADAESDDKQTD